MNPIRLAIIFLLCETFPALLGYEIDDLTFEEYDGLIECTVHRRQEGTYICSYTATFTTAEIIIRAASL